VSVSASDPMGLVSTPGFSEPEHDRTNNAKTAKKRFIFGATLSVIPRYHGPW
jgi:hypothetical protein